MNIPFNKPYMTGKELCGQARYENDWRVYARPASDAKGPIIAFMAALDALAAQGLGPTVNLRVIMDGEEEISSPNLVSAIEKYRDKLKADLMLVFDGPMHFTDQPTLVFGARGLQDAQLTDYGPKSGVHSGNYGNWIPNPALRLAHLLASMKDDRGNILVEGFGDDLVPIAKVEQDLIAAVPADDQRLLKVFGVAEAGARRRVLADGLPEAHPQHPRYAELLHRRRRPHHQRPSAKPQNTSPTKSARRRRRWRGSASR